MNQQAFFKMESNNSNYMKIHQQRANPNQKWKKKRKWTYYYFNSPLRPFKDKLKNSFSKKWHKR